MNQQYGGDWILRDCYFCMTSVVGCSSRKRSKILYANVTSVTKDIEIKKLPPSGDELLELYDSDKNIVEDSDEDVIRDESENGTGDES